MRCRIFSIASAGLLAFSGCDGPPQIVPVGPPGTEFVRVPVTPDTDAAALGESATQAKSLPTTPEASNVPPALPTKVGETVTRDSGLKYTTLVEGTGAECKSGQTISIHYVGTLASNGNEFDSSVGSGKPLSTRIGVGAVIPGWDEGVPGMKVGEKRKLEIPAKLAYGDQAQGEKIPANSDLVFVVELVSVQ
ncbi:FKBP-type peptidyl-prolyl cis-trans isomerase [Isosphaeraceae bacterium EP7]